MHIDVLFRIIRVMSLLKTIYFTMIIMISSDKTLFILADKEKLFIV